MKTKTAQIITETINIEQETSNKNTTHLVNNIPIISIPNPVINEEHNDKDFEISNENVNINMNMSQENRQKTNTVDFNLNHCNVTINITK